MKQSDMHNITEILQKEIQKELHEAVERILEKEVELVAEKLKDQVKEKVGGIAVRVANIVHFERMENRLTITIDTEKL